MDVHVLGVRHHGPGSARSVRLALEELEPDAILIEGPPEASAVAELAAHDDMQPPVALVVYAPEEPRRAAIYPFAVFSPEWQALRHALDRGVDHRFIDLPLVNGLATEDDDEDEDRPHDPLGVLARAAGYEDPERWWEDLVEHRSDGTGAFAAIGEAMGALREEAGPATGREARREAAMRQAIRAAGKEGRERVVVVCGAWHAPVLDPATFPPAVRDAELLRGLPKIKVATTWVPWTYDRLSLTSGYGAGVRAPGWYHHLYTAPDDAILVRWLQQAAAILRADGIDVSPAAVIEAVRLASTLATLRGRPLAGLPELDEAALAVLCGGNPLPLQLLGEKLTVGSVLGAVPAATPMVPVAEDLERRRRSLRLKFETEARVVDLDLRREIDLERSRLLHRLTLLDIPWGEWDPTAARGARGTFHEVWTLRWDPALAVRLIDAGRYGRTVAEAASARAQALAAQATDLRTLTGLVEASLLADLPDAVAAAMRAADARAADDGDVGRLMEALVPLARVSRYGSVRQVDVTAVAAAVDGLVVRICAGLSPACAALDDDAAALMRRRVDTVHSALATLDRDDLRDLWLGALAGVADRTDVHGLLVGRASRMLLDAERLDADDAGRRLSRALSAGEDPARGAAWVEGFLAGSGLLLLHDPVLLGLVDAWIARIGGATFDDVLPLLRRAFSGFPSGERRQLGDAVRRLSGAGGGPAAGPRTGEDDELDPERTAQVLPILRRLLGGTSS